VHELAIELVTAPWFAPQRLRVGDDGVEDGLDVVCDRPITRRISLVAVCCSRASVRIGVLGCSSFRSRAFSIAIAAWSAKVSMRATWLSVNARTRAEDEITPATPPPGAWGSRGSSGRLDLAGPERILRIRLDVEDVDRPSLEGGARARAVAARGDGLSSRKVRSSGVTFWTATTRSTRRRSA